MGTSADAALAEPSDAEARGLPNVIVIGAQKCGTSGLHYYLGLHPQVSVSTPKELNFFIAERNWPKGVDWYRGRFDPGLPVRADVSPNYTAHPQHKGVAERMARVVPDARLVYMVRDPIDRIAAHWVHNYSKGRHTGALARTILNPKASYVDRSLYAAQLERFLPYFGIDQILVLEQDDLRVRRGETLRRVFEYTGADPGFTDRRFAQERHKTERKTRLTSLGERIEGRRDRATRTFLPPEAWALARSWWPIGRRIERPEVRDALPEETIELLRADAKRLAELTGRDFGHWSVWER
ncbi:MAG: sulfotransferase domain-containing protein [Actinomycetota bacterium]|nr:sulfotransferase domain-containing protein [Actinomycetota bacterium]